MAVEKKNNQIDTIAIWSITPNGKLLGARIQNEIKGSVLFVSANICENNYPRPSHKQLIFVFKKLSREMAQQFNKFAGHVFIFSTGIAIRIIAPLLKSKTIDPAIVVVDDQANHAISFLSGHLGGANALTKKIAALVQADPVITTATDTNTLPSIDMIAQKNGIKIETPQNIKHINMAFLKGEPVNLYDPSGHVKKTLPGNFWSDRVDTGKKADGKNERKKIFCSHEIKKVSRETLILRPPVLSVGIGCNRGTEYHVIKKFLMSVLKAQGLSIDSVCKFGTTAVKKDETGLLKLSDEMQIKIDFYNKQELNAVTTIQTPSKMVEKHLGVKSVCEAAAILSAASSSGTSEESSGELIVTKHKNRDVTIAVAIKK